MITFLHSFQSEWLKRKHSLAAYLTVTGGLLIPAIVLIARLYYSNSLYTDNTSPRLWLDLYNRNWQYMGSMLLPMGVILVASLVTQVEFKNNSWKQLHITPQSYTVLFFAKLAVIIVMLIQCFILFIAGIYLCGVVPALCYAGVPFPKDAFPLGLILKGSGKFLIACLPIVALQYVLSIVNRNFLVPIGVGIVLWMLGIIAIKWPYSYWIPYTYCTYQVTKHKYVPAWMPVEMWALAYAVLFTGVGYIIYITRKDKS